MGLVRPEPGQFNNPRTVVVDSHGDVYVADSFNHRIQKLSATGVPWPNGAAAAATPASSAAPKAWS